VDVPALDGVAFIDPRKSEIDIVQAVGRAIRLSAEKTKGTIIIPVFISDDDDPDVVLSSSEFDKVWKVVNALRAHDDALGEELDSIRTQLGKQGSTGRPEKIVFDIPTRIGEQFATAFDTRLVEATTASWYFWFGLLEAYVKQEGHALVSQRFTTLDGFPLGVWVNNQRRRQDTLMPDQIGRVESLPGWVWDARDYIWQEGFNYLTSFVDKYGHGLVERGYKSDDGFALGLWVKRQRDNRSKLNPDRIALLESVPKWKWLVKDSWWEKGIEELRDYAEQQGHARVPARHVTDDGFALGVWVNNQRQRRATLSKHQGSQLESFPDWAWSLAAVQWEDGVRHLRSYAQKFGHAKVPQNTESADGFKLGIWVSAQRRKKEELSSDQVSLLEALPEWTWNVLYARWEEGFGHLEGFVKRKGHARVSRGDITEDGFKLDIWVNTQRQNIKKNRLSKEQIARLEALPGWVWDVRLFQWEDGFSHLEAFVNREGHAKVPKGFYSEDGYALGSWVDKRRHRKDKMSPEQIVRLEALPGWVWKVR
jgi:hypothetical protein